MKKTQLGIILGIVVGIVDVIPMIIQKLTWDANLSAFSLWVVSGFLVSSSDLKVKGAIKGVLISILVLIPSAILIGWQQPTSLVPITIMTLLLGSILGILLEKLNK